MINKLIDAVKHGLYVYGVAFVGTLATVQGGYLDVSDIHALEVAVAPAAIAALYKAVPALAKGALTGAAKSILSAAAVAPAAPAAPVAPVAVAQDIVNP